MGEAKILIVEDEAPIREGLKARLEQEGYRVVAAQTREAGLPTSLRVEGEARPLPPGLDLSAFRIVQEAITNVLKHAERATAEVVVRYGPTHLELRIDDDGTPVHHQPVDLSRPRYGHLGMRERVALFGGELSAGPRPGGGYRVTASLPIDGETP